MTTRDEEKLLILGFFNRGNLGDEAFIRPYQLLFPSSTIIFQSIDDLDRIPNDTSAIIIAGGDVITDYFMKQISVQLQSYKGPCYAFSVGIPYDSEVKYTKLFDHIVVRTQADYDLTSKYIGGKNVNFLPDITWLLKPLVKQHVKKQNRLQIAFCLAQPAFFKNKNEEKLVDSIVTTIKCILQKYNCDVNLLSFNTSYHPQESDYIINKKIENRLLSYSRVRNITDKAICTPLEMLNYIKKQDLVIGMRFHSIQFSLISSIPFVALYTSKKVQNLINDMRFNDFGYCLEKDSTYKPAKIDPNVLLEFIDKRLNTPFKPVYIDLKQFDMLKEIIRSKKKKQILVRYYVDNTITETQIKCKNIVKRFLDIDDTVFLSWDNNELNTKELLDRSRKSPTDLAKIICFAITNAIGTSYIWGLSNNMLEPNFRITDTIKWIYEDYVAKGCELEKEQIYYPLMNPDKHTVIDLNYMCQDNYQGLHRSGWSYVIAGLQHLDCRNVNKPHQLMVDTCLERTFFWEADIAKVAKIIPYQKPWVGFVHHTFNTSYSSYNCNTLLNTEEFLQSLSQCKCIFTLTQALQEEFSKALEKKGFGHIHVETLIHPTEVNVKQFSLSTFLNTPEPKVINIGAWLRNPYTIYALQMPKSSQVLGLRKYSLKGKEMDNYFLPKEFYTKLEYYLGNECYTDYSNTVSRPEVTSEISNKHIALLLDHLKHNDASVTTLGFVSNEEYDNILSSSIVFLDFVDQPAASNTICECIVRNTPVIVNRFASLEELLGKEYPGFYDSLYDAVTKIGDIVTLRKIHEYIKKMDKTKFKLEYFIADFQSKLQSHMIF